MCTRTWSQDSVSDIFFAYHSWRYAILKPIFFPETYGWFVIVITIIICSAVYARAVVQHGTVIFVQKYSLLWCIALPCSLESIAVPTSFLFSLKSASCFGKFVIVNIAVLFIALTMAHAFLSRWYWVFGAFPYSVHYWCTSFVHDDLPKPWG